MLSTALIHVFTALKVDYNSQSELFCWSFRVQGNSFNTLLSLKTKDVSSSTTTQRWVNKLSNTERERDGIPMI